MPTAGVVALDLARSLLREHPGSYALVVSHENVTNSYYCGRDKSMLGEWGRVVCGKKGL
jgi:3-ketoacyl-CoA synthase